ncbi:hypothetical protein PGT21_026635 [Puccinia graminis f. sp. tritici]|uniref:NAD(P)H-hydrate epimerase n=1 Tax=Puccinia graminis f. sp. tritici TaxID=56615 RepID=A0A5B0M4H0_PUCGR|nr:hypothetical protein PGT21_026635 [Puccinia graminis f. sp. tritici]KAA1135164.1 hypothetical protein PGTUg99_004004 [Puccinia graminis f. sp. tritici]
MIRSGTRESWSVAAPETKAEMGWWLPVICSLLQQCETLGIPVIGANFSEALEETDVILDAIFGFSFHSEPRAPFDEPIRSFKQTQTPIVSVDIPSGWDIETGNPNQVYFTPNVLVSLTAPKRGVKAFPGRHFLGGRFIPPGIVKSYNLKLPCYPSSDQVVEITAVHGEDK